MKLVQYLQQNNLKQKEFAKKIGVSCATISNLVAMKFDIHLSTALSIEEATEGQVTCKDLLVKVKIAPREI